MIVNTLQEFFFNPDYEKTVLIQSDYLAYGIVIGYMAFVKALGPSLMKQRRALELYYLVILFNILLMIGNAYMCFVISKLAMKCWDIRCNLKNDPDFKSIHKEFGYLAWQILLVKIAELLDTVIFVLRKKFNQVSFLHVFHHSFVVVLCLTAVKSKEIAYYAILIGAINSGVHVVSYLYYGLAAMGPGVRKYLWWKKYLTTIQILQFLAFLIYLAYSFLTDCEEFSVFGKMFFGITAVVCILFFNFYFKTYSKTK